MGKSNSGPRVCVVRLSPFPGDPRLNREVRALLEENFSIDVICIRKRVENDTGQFPGVKIYRMPLFHKRRGRRRYLMEYALFFIMAFVTVSFLHLVKRYKVVQVNTLPDVLVFSALIPKILGARLVLDMHESTPEMYAAKFHVPMDSFQVKLVAFVEKMSTRFANSVICVSEPHMDALVGRGIPERKLETVMNVAEDRLFYHRPSNGLYVRASDELRLVCHGTILERYGFQTVVQAIALLKDRLPGLRLSLIGDGEMMPILKEMAERLGVENRITFHGYVPMHLVPSHIAKCNVGVVPNLKDCFTDLILPTKLMEYVLMKKPIITSRTKAVERYFDDSMVLYYEPGQASDLAERIAELYHDVKKMEDLVTNAQRFAERYTWKSTKDTYVGLLRRLSNGAHG